MRGTPADVPLNNSSASPPAIASPPLFPAPGPVSTYVVGHETSGLVKIGKSTNVAERFAALCMGSPVELSLLFCFAGDYERKLHSAFRKYRLHGEWFDRVIVHQLAQVMSGMPV